MRNSKLSRVVICSMFVLLSVCALADEDWFDPNWKHRSRLEITTPPLQSGLNVARVYVDTKGYATSDGADIRVTDTSGSIVGFEVVKAVTERTFLVEFEVNGGSTYYCYFGNSAAPKLSHQWNKVLGGLTVETFAGKVQSSPLSLSSYKKMLRGKRSMGKARREQIDDEENPLGSNDPYFAVYDGFLYAPVDGSYGFATYSDDASFLEVDGREVVSWPGSHTAVGHLWSHQNRIHLQQGVHRLRYYMQDIGGLQVACAGWSPPGREYKELIPALKAGVLSFEHVHGSRDGYSFIPPKSFIDKLTAEQRTWQRRGKKPEALFVARDLGHVVFNNNELTLYPVWCLQPGANEDSRGRNATWEFGDETGTDNEWQPVHFFKNTGVHTITLRSSLTSGPLTQEVVVEPGPRRWEWFEWKMTPSGTVFQHTEDISIDVWAKSLTKGMDLEVVAIAKSPAENPEKRLPMAKQSFSLPSSQERTVTMPLVKAGQPDPRWRMCDVELRLGGQTIARESVRLVTPRDQLGSVRQEDGHFRDTSGAFVLLRADQIRKPADVRKKLKSVWTLALAGSDLFPLDAAEPSFFDLLSGRIKGLDLVTMSERGRKWRMRDLAMACLSWNFPKDSVVLLSLDPVDVSNAIEGKDWSRMLGFVLDVVRAHGAEPVVLLPPPLPESPLSSAKMNAEGRRSCIGRGVYTIDLAAVFRQKNDWQDMFLSEGTYRAHPSEQGQRLIGDAICEHFSSWR